MADERTRNPMGGPVDMVRRGFLLITMVIAGIMAILPGRKPEEKGPPVSDVAYDGFPADRGGAPYFPLNDKKFITPSEAMALTQGGTDGILEQLKRIIFKTPEFIAQNGHPNGVPQETMDAFNNSVAGQLFYSIGTIEDMSIATGAGVEFNLSNDRANLVVTFKGGGWSSPITDIERTRVADLTDRFLDQVTRDGIAVEGVDIPAVRAAFLAEIEKPGVQTISATGQPVKSPEVEKVR